MIVAATDAAALRTMDYLASPAALRGQNPILQVRAWAAWRILSLSLQDRALRAAHRPLPEPAAQAVSADGYDPSRKERTLGGDDASRELHSVDG